jgi:DNA helicase-2/ATP-dependent DNA helicase PcrA
MDRIYLTSTDLRRSYMGPEYKRPSRFLNEIPRELLEVKAYTSEYSGGRDYSGGGYSYNGYSPQRRETGSSAATSPVKKFQLPAEERSSPGRSSSAETAEQQEPSATGSQFSLRERVLHPKYGPGRIVKIEGSGDNIKLTISFGITNRVFMEKYTPLQKMN